MFINKIFNKKCTAAFNSMIILIVLIGILLCFNWALKRSNTVLKLHMNEVEKIKILTQNYQHSENIIDKNMKYNSHIEGVKYFRYMSCDYIRKFFFKNRMYFEEIIANANKSKTMIIAKEEMEVNKKNLDNRFNMDFNEAIAVNDTDEKNLKIIDLQANYMFYFPGNLFFAYSPDNRDLSIKNSMIINANWRFGYSGVLQR